MGKKSARQRKNTNNAGGGGRLPRGQKARAAVMREDLQQFNFNEAQVDQIRDMADEGNSNAQYTMGLGRYHGRGFLEKDLEATRIKDRGNHDKNKTSTVLCFC